MLLLALIPALALAKANGIAATSCAGFHGGGLPAPTVTLTGPQQSIAPGATITLTLTIGGGITNVGFHLTSFGVGTFTAGTGTRLQGDGISHSAPRAASNRSVTSTVSWTAPNAPGGGELEVAVARVRQRRMRRA